VIGPTGAVRVLVATTPVDFRKGAEGLAALVRETMKADPFSGAVYVFRAKRADRVKLIYWDGTGVCLFAKRLEDGKFRWPNMHDGVMRLSAAELSALLEGLDWKRVHAARETPAPISLHDCGTVNQPVGNARDAARRLIYSRHDDRGGCTS
jgi:transposase